jgi:hypothetical protein
MRSTSTVAPVVILRWAVVAALFSFALAAGGTPAHAQPADDPAPDPAADPADDEQPIEPSDTGDDDPENGDGDATPPTGDEGGEPAEGEDAPVNLRLRRLEQNVQSLKERAWRSKARVGMLKEAVLGGGIGARATLVHRNKMGRAFRLEKVVYAVDGTQVFARQDDTSKLHDQKTVEVLSGPIAPGNHTISVLLVYRGSGFGPFKYLKKYKYTVKSSHTFTAVEGKHTRIEIVGFEKGGWNTQLRDRPGVDYRVTTSDGGPK